MQIIKNVRQNRYPKAPALRNGSEVRDQDLQMIIFSMEPANHHQMYEKMIPEI